jgi:hypothetical protein
MYFLKVKSVVSAIKHRRKCTQVRHGVVELRGEALDDLAFGEEFDVEEVAEPVKYKCQEHRELS